LERLEALFLHAMPARP